MARSKQLPRIFRSLKTHHHKRSNTDFTPTKSPPSPSSSSSSYKSKQSWFVYLIISTNPPIKTYVGSTSNFSRRLKQHNGELRGGAKASRAGRPWVCACLIRGFKDQSEACVVESKWKSISKKMPRKRKKTEEGKVADGPLALLQHRQAALNRLKCLIDCTYLEIDWQLKPS